MWGILHAAVHVSESFAINLFQFSSKKTSMTKKTNEQITARGWRSARAHDNIVSRLDEFSVQVLEAVL